MRITCEITADNGRAITNKVINKPLIAFNKSDLLMFAIFSCGRSLQREITLNLYKLSPKLQKADQIGNKRYPHIGIVTTTYLKKKICI